MRLSSDPQIIHPRLTRNKHAYCCLAGKWRKIQKYVLFKCKFKTHIRVHVNEHLIKI